MAKHGMLLVLSAPSGTGKLTLINRLRDRGHHFATTVSATTRGPRAGEIDGKDYYFLDRSEFESRRDAREFVEWAEVHGNLYGTLASELDRCLATGDDVVLEVDIQGMRNLRALRDDAVSVFLMPPNMEELERRLRNRGTDSDDKIALRLRNAEGEMAARHEFEHIVVNDDIDRAASEVEDIIETERARRDNQE